MSTVNRRTNVTSVSNRVTTGSGVIKATGNVLQLHCALLTTTKTISSFQIGFLSTSMKFLTSLSAGIALLSTQAHAHGVCYDPNHAASGTMTAESVVQDMAVIKSNGFNAVRTYISKFGDTNMGLTIASANANLTVALGVPYPNNDYVEQMDAALTAANAGGVAYIFVGNENLAGATSVPSDMIHVITSIKSLVPKSVKVGTVQRNTEVINYQGIAGWTDLVAACDVLGVNIHPFFTPATTADRAIDVVNTQWTVMKKTFGEKLMLTETGWPSDGTLSGCIGSYPGLQTFYSDYTAWSSSMVESFYFQMFDTPYKTTAFEKSFGLVTSDSTLKFLLSTALSAVGTVAV